MASAELARARELLSYLASDPDATIEELRRRYDEVCAHFVPGPDVRVSDVDAGGVPARWVISGEVRTDAVAVMLHGGGWAMGTADGYVEFAGRVSAAAQCAVLVVDYRLAPEQPYPAALDDAVNAYRWACERPGVEVVALVGDSAGGGLVVSSLVRIAAEGGQRAAASVVCSPLVDLAGEGASLQDRAHLDPLPAATLVSALGGIYLAGRAPKETPLASPLYADLAALPDLLVLVGTDEGLYDDSERLVTKIRESGGRAELLVGDRMVHIWPIFSFLPEAHIATDRIGRFLAAGFDTALAQSGERRR